MTPHEILKAAREKIAVPQRWTKGAYARASDGWALVNDSPDACRFCATGALNRVSTGASIEAKIDAYRALRDAIGYDVELFNDTHKHADVLAKLDAAIAATTPAEEVA